MTEREGPKSVRGGLDPALSSTEMRLSHRRFKRYISLAALSLFALPLLFFVVLMFVPTGSTDSVAGVLGILAVMLFALFLGLLPFILAGGFVVAIVWAIVQHRRKAVGRDVLAQRAAWFPQEEGSADAATPRPGGGKAAGVDDRPVPPEFADDLAALETLRAGIARTARRRERTFVPLTVAGVLLFWFLGDMNSGEGSPLLALVLLVTLPAGFVWIWIRHDAQQRYARAFKTAVMPRLVGRHGDLRYGPVKLPALAPLVEHGVLPAHDTATVDDGIDGTYRGHRLRIAEVVLKKRSKKNGESSTEVYRGLLIDFETARPLPATTVILDKTAPSLRHALERRGLERIRLEDPLFDEVYTVFGTDQIAARALLTPATMQRFLVMADGQAFYPPHLLAHGGSVAFATRRWDNLDLFEPASLFSNDATQMLLAQERDLADIFLLIDAMTTVRGVGRSASPSAAT